ncbi:unnamed protein product [Trichobilharzia regenti]|nr:unnamed protein product [Trichobilharzia regenti]
MRIVDSTTFYHSTNNISGNPQTPLLCPYYEMICQWKPDISVEFINWSLDLEASKPRLREYDSDGDGLLTWSEYTSKIYGYTEKELEEFRKDSKNETKLFVQSLDDEKLKFDSADLDKNGYLNESEFVAFEHPHNYRHMAPYELKHTLRDFDKDKDGYISEVEYLADGKSTL